MSELMKKSAIYSMFGKYYGTKLYNLLNDCCGNEFCNQTKTCLGISETGDENLLFNQKGEFVPANVDFSNLPFYQTGQEATSGLGLNKPYLTSNGSSFILGYTKQGVLNYTAGRSTIDFIPDGIGGFDISVKIVPDSVQLPSGVTITDYQFEILFYGSGTGVYDNIETTDKTVNTGVRGAGVYEVRVTYNCSDGSYFQIGGLLAVDATSVLGYYINEGVTVNSINGLVVNATAIINQSETIVPDWAIFDGSSFTPVASGVTANVVTETDTIAVLFSGTLPALFSAYPDPDFSGGFTLVIS
jgi:hypothetical protein